MYYTNESLSFYYKIIKVLIDDYIKEHDIQYKAVIEAPNDYDSMVSFYKDNNFFSVYSGGDHGFLGADYNIKFRALHDYMHFNYDLNFSFKNEKKLSKITGDIFSELCNKRSIDDKITGMVVKILDAEIKGQIEYYQKFNDYVKNQKKFIFNYVNFRLLKDN